MKPVHILLVEDNEGDILLTKEVFAEMKLNIQFSVVRDGKEAEEFLNREGKYAAETLPDLLLLDINLPKKNGHEVLQHVKRTDFLKHIPVIMLTTSSSEKDINFCYLNYASCFITKPNDVDEFISVVGAIENFWLSAVRLPAIKANSHEKR